MVITTPQTGPRQELAVAVEQGAGSPLDLIGEKILPAYGLNYRTAHYIRLTAADTQARRTIADAKFLRASGTKFERFSMKFADGLLSVVTRGVEADLPFEAQMDYDRYLDIEQVVCTRMGQIQTYTTEYLIMSAVTSTATFGAATNSAVPYTAANAQTNSFFSDVISATRRGKARGERYDTLEMSGPVFERVRQSPYVLSYLRGIYGAGIVEISVNAIQQALAEFGIKQVLIGDCYVNTGAEGTQVDTQVWPNGLMWIGRAGNVSTPADLDGVAVPTFGGIGIDTFWEGYDNNGLPTADTEGKTFAGGNYVEVYPDKSTDTWIVRLKMSKTPTILNANAGELIATQYA